ncbi:uncharacterized protein LOC142628710 [Castanea sativa]|uniref:uncharacterized protein LOC142628710 n=1 Tax=Castanea sativa TaxID=21020 RepID=UPI003F651AF8
MFVSYVLAEESGSKPKRIKGNISPILGFSDEDKVGTIQPHNDALVVTLRIGGYDVRRVMVDQGPKTVDVDFIVVDAYSPYTAIMARPCLHALGAVSSTLHVKVKFPSGEQIEEILGSQSVARQCISAMILHQAEPRSSASATEDL